MSSKVKLVADSGSTKAAWCLMNGKGRGTFHTQGMSPYFLNGSQIEAIIRTELVPLLGDTVPDEVHYYGTGCGSEVNRAMIKSSFEQIWPSARIEVQHDLMAAARALCGHEPGVASILGTGSNSCYYDGKEVVKNNPGIGFILGDEGSGAFLGKKIVQYYMYHTFDDEMRFRFEQQFKVDKDQILENVYKKPLPNRYLASFTPFLSENRGHYMIENILEDGLNDFFFNHIYKYSESWTVPLHFTGSIAWHFRDILEELCQLYELQLGKVIKDPMDGLTKFHEEE